MDRNGFLHANTAAIGQMYVRTADVMRAALDRLTTPSFYDDYYRDFHDHVEECRRVIVDLLSESELSGGARVDADDIALMPSTSDGIAAILEAYAQELRPGSTIAVGRMCFGSILIVLRGYVEQGVRVVEIGNDDGEVLPEHVERVAGLCLLIVDLVNYVTGRKNRIAPLADTCAARGVPIVVDAVQGLGATTVDFRVAQVDALACGGYKWLRGPEGTGFLYVNPRQMPRLRPLRRGYRSLADPSRFEVDLGPVHLSDRARQFEVGTLNAVGFLGLSAAISGLVSMGVGQAAGLIRAGTEEILGVLSGIPAMKVATPMDPEGRAGIVSFRHDSIRSEDLADRLRRLRVTCGIRRGLVRLSASFDADIEALCGRLREALGGS